MAKIEIKHKWDDCPYALFPFGKSMPVCSFGVKIPEGKEPNIKYFYHCCKNGECRKEVAINVT